MSLTKVILTVWSTLTFLDTGRKSVVFVHSGFIHGGRFSLNDIVRICESTRKEINMTQYYLT